MIIFGQRRKRDEEKVVRITRVMMIMASERHSVLPKGMLVKSCIRVHSVKDSSSSSIDGLWIKIEYRAGF